MNESRDSLDHFFEVQTEPLVFFVQQNEGNFYVSLKLSKSCCVTSLSFLSLSLSLLYVLLTIFLSFLSLPFSPSLSLFFIYFSAQQRKTEGKFGYYSLLSFLSADALSFHLSLTLILFFLCLRLCPIIYDGILKKYRVAHKSEGGKGKTFFVIKTELSKVFHVSSV